MRLDLFLAENGYADSRTAAKNLICAGAVTVNGKTVDKPSYDVPENANILVDKSGNPFASRGGLKLAAALDTFGIDPADSLALDVGASSGGFTDCLLQCGAKSVIAVDSGSGQMADFLRRDPRVTVIENYNARYMRADDFEYRPNLVVMDVSFISATYIIPAISEVILPGGSFVCLIKPQFEVGRSGIGKGGIVKSPVMREGAVKKVVDCAEEFGLRLVSNMQSPIVGGDGNVEFLAYFRKVCEDI